MSSTKRSRRSFLTRTARGALAAGLFTTPFSAMGSSVLGANDKVVVGLIGANGMGFWDLTAAMRVTGVECGAICDVDDNVLDKRIGEITKLQGKAPKRHKDFRKLLEDPSISAVIVGTPDHWHCLPTILACEAGKDVYVEKPLANSIGECDLMVRAARKYKRVVQVGQQQRSGEHWMQAMEFMKSGKIGQLRKVQVWGNFNYGIGDEKSPDSEPAAGVDYNMWLGPAPQRAFNKSRFHGNWRMFWDYGGGLLTDWGVHLLDMALWVKDVKELPLAVTAAGGNWAYPDHAHETFDTMSVTYQLSDYIISWEHTAGTQAGPYGRMYGLAFVGNDATLVIDRDGWELFPELQGGKYKVPAIPRQGARDSHGDHLANFIECIKSGKEPACPIDTARLAAVYAHMGNIALRSQSRLAWNSATGNFGTNAAANALITSSYRKPWALPGNL